MRTFLERFVVLAVTVLLAISFLNLDTAKYDTAVRLWLPLLIGIGILLPALLLRFRGVQEKPITSLVLAGFCSAIWISFVFSQTKNYGFTEAVVYSFAGLLALSLSSIKKRAFQSLLYIVVIFAVASSLYGFFYFPIHGESRMAGLFLDAKDPRQFFPNAFANFLLMAWPLVLMRKQWWKILLLPVLLAALYLTYSRGAWAAFVIQLIFLAVITFKNRVQWNFKKNVISFGVIAALVFTFVFTLTSLRNKNFSVISPTEKLTFQNVESRTSLAERVDFWIGSLKLIAEEPLKGFGPMSFRYAYPHVEKRMLAISDHPHNWFLKIGVENGLPAVLLFIIFLSIVFRQSIKLPITNYQLQITLASLGAILHNMVDYNMNFIPNIIVFFILAAGLLTAPERPQAADWLKKMSVAIWIFIGAITMVTSFHEMKISLAKRADADNVAIEENSYVARDEIRNKAEELQKSGEEEKADTLLNIHLAKNPLDAYAWYLKGDSARALKLDPMNNLAYYKEKTINREQKTVEQVKKLLQEYEGLLSQNIHYTAFTSNPEEAAKLYELLGEPEKAQALREKTARIRKEFAQNHQFGKELAPRTFW